MISRIKNKQYIHTVKIDCISMAVESVEGVKLHGIVSFGVQNLVSVVVATDNMVLEEGHERPIAVVAHQFPPPMIC